jgi:hypothetical protein
VRKLHRWISAAAMALLAWVAITGTLLACLEVTVPYTGMLPSNYPQPGPFQFDAHGPALDASALEAQLLTSLRATTRANHGAGITAVDIQLQGDVATPRASVTLTGGDVQQFTFDASTGKSLAPVTSTSQVANIAAATGRGHFQVAFLRARPYLHYWLERLHRGNIIGISGQVMDILTGLSFIFLSVTGIVMYFQMLARRRKIGRPALFWK